jgi:hypothetical protein
LLLLRPLRRLLELRIRLAGLSSALLSALLLHLPPHLSLLIGLWLNLSA